MDIEVYADERKRISGNWDYLAILVVPCVHREPLLSDLRSERLRYRFDGEIRFGSLHAKGIGTRLDTAKGWLRLLIDDAANKRRRQYFSVTGIDNSKIDYRLFGDDGSPRGKYATIYNRFFRASLLGVLRYCFPHGPIRIVGIYHDTEGNLQNHDYFDWHTIRQISKEESRVHFVHDRVTFVHSHPRREGTNPGASEMVQFTDLILGTITHAIQLPNRTNIGQLECVKEALPFIKDVLANPYEWAGQHDQLRRFAIAHFPMNRQHELMEGSIPGEYYRPSLGPIDEIAYGQGSFGF